MARKRVVLRPKRPGSAIDIIKHRMTNQLCKELGRPVPVIKAKKDRK